MLAAAVKRKEGFQFSGLDALALVLTEPDRLTYNVARYGGLVWEFEEE